MIEINDKGLLIADGIMIGKVDATSITLDLGWCKAAGVHVIVRGDPEVDHRRGGIVLDR